MLQTRFYPSFVLLTAACTSVNHSQYGNGQMGNLVLVEPLPANMRSQMALARYNQILGQVELNDSQRAICCTSAVPCMTA